MLSISIQCPEILTNDLAEGTSAELSPRMKERPLPMRIEPQKRVSSAISSGPVTPNCWLRSRKSIVPAARMGAGGSTNSVATKRRIFEGSPWRPSSACDGMFL